VNKTINIHNIMGKKRRAKKSSDGTASSSGSDMDDIMAQLQLQREKQKQTTKENKVDVSPVAKGKKQKKRETAPSIKQEIGDFRFDPISNRYLPKSSFNKPDRFEAQTKVKNVSIDRLRWGKRNSISDEDVRKILFHGSALDYSRPPQPNMQAQNKNRKKRNGSNESSIKQQADAEQQIPCSNRIVQLLTTSLQYANSHKRNGIVNILGPIAMARGATVVPSAVSDDMLTLDAKSMRSDPQPLVRGMQQGTSSRQSRKLNSAENVQHPIQAGIQQLTSTTARISTVKSSSNTLNQKWHSLLFPMNTCVGNPLNDCVCKTYLPPTASTFDIQSHANSIPSVVTIADNELFCRQSSFIPPDGRRAFQSDASPNDDRAWNLSVFNHADTTNQCVKFAPSANHMGILANDSSLQYCFAIKNFDSKSASSMHVPLQLDNGQVNDFCFSSNDHNKLAYFCGLESKFGLSYLDITTGQVLRFTKRKKSEALSVQYLGDQVICGHRNGSVSLHDGCGNQVSANVTSSLGSATSLHPLQDGNSVVVKGSFGSCCVLDVRKFQNTIAGTSKAIVMDLPVPLSLVHTTNSTRCTGIALDPRDTIVISPFAGQNNVSFALWCLKTGKFLRNIDLGTSDNNTQLPPFCELSSRTTPGFAIREGRGSTLPLITKESDFGVWFKSGPNPLAPPSCGGIHHLSFLK